MKTLPQNTALNQTMLEVLDRAQQKGATQAAVSVNHDMGFSVDVRMKEVETVAFSEDNGVSVTVFINKQKGSASSSDISPKALDSMVDAAIEIAKVSAGDPCFGLADENLMDNNFPDLDLYHPWDINPQQAIQLALDCENLAFNSNSKITNSDGVNVSTYNFIHGYANSYGFKGIIESSRHSISCSLVAKEENSMQRDYAYSVARMADNLLPINKIAELAAERAVKRLSATKIKTQKIPVIFSSRVSNSLFSAFIHAISGSNIYRKNSFLVDAIGQQIFPKFINVYEQPHLLGALGSMPFDGEGVLTRNNIWVKEGKLLSYVLSSYSARKLGLKTTANSGGVFNLTIDPTHGELKELLSLMNRGLLVTELMGQGANILTGNYSRGASGFWVENGEIQYPVEEITIAGNLKNMFENILAVGSDINPNLSTRCGSVLLAEMTIAGG